MAIYYCGLSDRRAPIALRERLSFTKGRVEEVCAQLARRPGIRGCVLLSTCNRTELYCSWEGELPPGPQLLCEAAGVELSLFDGAFRTLSGEEAGRHLFEVAAGLRSRIWGEDQVLSQVREALTIARRAGSTDSVLETLFRIAVSAGKELRSKVRVSGVSPSSAARAVEVIQAETGGLSGKRALVIGNGEMGRLSARLLREAGCAVTVTLRTYRHGETVVPAGCAVAPYEERYQAMEGMDLLLSATTSPHYTVGAEEYDALSRPPRLLVDLAIPRDIAPQVGERADVTLYNIDTLGCGVERVIPPEGEAILTAAMERFRQWEGYRSSLGAIEEVKAAVLERVLAAGCAELEPEEAAELAVSRAVELLAGNLKGCLSAEDLTHCARKIRAHTRA